MDAQPKLKPAFPEESLHEVEDETLFHLRLLDAVEQGIAATNLDGEILYWNKYAHRLTGIDRDIAIRNSIFDFITAASSDETSFRVAIQTGFPWRGECQVAIGEKPDLTCFTEHGKFRAISVPIRVVLSPILNSSSQLIGTAISFREITLEKAQIRDIEKRSLLLANAAELGRLAIETTQRDEFYRQVMVRLSTLLSLDSIRIMHFSMWEGVPDSVLQSGEPCRILLDSPNDPRVQFANIKERNPIFVLGEEASQTWSRFHPDHFHDDPERIFGFQIAVCEEGVLSGFIEGGCEEPRSFTSVDWDFIQFLSSLVTRVFQRDQSERLFKSLFENAIDAVMIADDKSRYIDVNHAACEMLGYTRQELTQLSLIDLIPHNSPDSIDEQWTDFLNSRSSRGEIKLVRKDGVTVIAEFGAVTSVVPGVHIAILRDITARKKAEATIAEQKDQLTHIQRMVTMGQLSSIIAHEINQPLCTISLLSGGLILGVNDEDDQSEEMRRNLDQIGREALKAGAIVNRLRKYITLGTFELTDTDIHNILRETIRSLKNFLASTSTTIRLNLCDKPLKIKADPIRLEQVFINLIKNSCEAMAENSAEDRFLEISTCIVESEAKVIFRDNGPPVSSEEFQKIMQPYHSTKANGLGMGLCISRSIVEQHKGRLQTELGESGSLTAIISLPIAQQPILAQ